MFNGSTISGSLFICENCCDTPDALKNYYTPLYKERDNIQKHTSEYKKIRMEASYMPNMIEEDRINMMELPYLKHLTNEDRITMNNEKSEQTNCLMCLEKFTELRPAIREFQCRHFLCEGCVNNVKEKSCNCPYCKAQLIKDIPFMVFKIV